MLYTGDLKHEGKKLQADLAPLLLSLGYPEATPSMLMGADWRGLLLFIPKLSMYLGKEATV